MLTFKHHSNESVYGVLAAALSGILLFTATPNFDYWIFAWVAMVPMFSVIEHASTKRRALFYGWYAGIVGNAGGFYWMLPTIERFGGVPVRESSALSALISSTEPIPDCRFRLSLDSLSIVTTQGERIGKDVLLLSRRLWEERLEAGWPER